MLHPRSPHNPHPTLLAIMGDYAIAQSSQQPPTAPPPSTSDPLTTYGVVAALVFSMGGAVVNLVKNYIGTVSKRSEIELKAQESQNQRSQDIATTMMRQQETLVNSLSEDRRRDREQLEKLTSDMIAANIRFADAIEHLSELIRSKL